MAVKQMYLYGGAYDSIEDARADLEHIKELHKQKHVGAYDAVAITKDDDGSVKVDETDATQRGSGAWKGALAGAAVGIIFPPSVLIGAAYGAGVGALAGDVYKPVDAEDARQLAELIAPGESGVLFVSGEVDEAFTSAILRRATRQNAIVVDADTDIVEAALKAAGR